jgi:hypothetical protein
MRPSVAKEGEDRSEQDQPEIGQHQQCVAQDRSPVRKIADALRAPYNRALA